MNRIIIIGNGFDKAHGLPTGYGDFLDHIKHEIVHLDPDKKNGFTTGDIKGLHFKKDLSNIFIRKTQDNNPDPWLAVEVSKMNFANSRLTTYGPKSIYFKSLFELKEKNGNWSDLESLYFEKIFEHKENDGNIKLINEEFEHITKLLHDYLKKEIENNFGNELKYRVSKEHKIYKHIEESTRSDYSKTYFITFNYTSRILNQYYFWLRDKFGENKFSTDPIHIHGQLDQPKNPIIFGYGDENSAKYKEIENIGNNTLLTNFKTFKYLRTNNYKSIFRILDHGEGYDIQIYGHSCGLCDKALLRGIFQHRKVNKIESTYFGDESKYFDNLYNISRIFDDNVIMRNKVISLDETYKVD